MYAAEARRQQALMEFQKLVKGKKKPKYPSPFKNHNNEVDLPIPPGETKNGLEWYHQPLIPGRNEPWRDRQPPGAVRSVWTPGKPLKFVAMNHDDSKGFTTNKEGKKTARFGISRYHPAAGAQPNDQQ